MSDLDRMRQLAGMAPMQETAPAKSGADFNAVARWAKEDSENGYVQHVNADDDGHYWVSDWYDSDTTVASYENGRHVGGLRDIDEATLGTGGLKRIQIDQPTFQRVVDAHAGQKNASYISLQPRRVKDKDNLRGIMGKREHDYDLKTNSDITRISSEATFGVPTVEIWTNKDSGDEKFFAYVKPNQIAKKKTEGAEEMREWANSIYDEIDDRGQYMDHHPADETIDLSLRKYLNAEPMKVSVSENDDIDYDALMEEYRKDQ